jgi:hypothetical protein
MNTIQNIIDYINDSQNFFTIFTDLESEYETLRIIRFELNNGKAS